MNSDTGSGSLPPRPRTRVQRGYIKRGPKGETPAGSHRGHDGPVKLRTIFVLVNLKSSPIRKLWG